jgi:hypothetical protein
VCGAAATALARPWASNRLLFVLGEALPVLLCIPALLIGVLLMFHG